METLYERILYLEQIHAKEGDKLSVLENWEDIVVPFNALSGFVASLNCFTMNNHATKIVSEWYDSLRKDGYTAVKIKREGNSLAAFATKEKILCQREA